MIDNEFSNLVLERIKVTSRRRATAEMLRSSKVMAVRDEIGDALTFQLETYVLADKLLDEQRIYRTSTVVEVDERHWKWGFIPRTRKRLVTVPVSVEVRREHFATFPESRMRSYAAELGRPYWLDRVSLGDVSPIVEAEAGQ